MNSPYAFDEADLTDELIFIYIVDPIITALLRQQQSLENSENGLNDDDNIHMDTSDIYEDTVGEATDECEEGLVMPIIKAKFGLKVTTKPDFELSCKRRDFGAESGVEMELDNAEDLLGTAKAELNDEGVHRVLPEVERLEHVEPSGVNELEGENGGVDGGKKEGENDGDYCYDGDCESQGEKGDEHRSDRCKKR